LIPDGEFVVSVMVSLRFV